MEMTPKIETQSYSKMIFNSLLTIPDGEYLKTCIQCGTCAGICPFGRWMDYTPRKMVAAFLFDEFEQVLDSNTVWMCVSCYACTQACPRKIPLTAGLMTKAKEEMVLAGKVPEELQTAFENTQRYGNPLGIAASSRAKWAREVKPAIRILAQDKQPVDILWFVGDYASYHPKIQPATIAFAKILHALGIDFAILGSEEQSEGDSQRLAGEHGLFEWLVEKNGRTLGKYHFNQIVTTDPHAYDAFKNEYPARGISYPVQHYTQFLASWIDQLKPLLTHPIQATVAYHDPCYLGRVNGIFDEPRSLLSAIPGVELVEMAHTRVDSLCCGGGGGGMWLAGFKWNVAGKRLSNWRVQESVTARPIEDFISIIGDRKKVKRRSRTVDEDAHKGEKRILAVACPYEKPRFEDAVKTVEMAKDVQVKDISELLIEAMQPSEV